MIIDEHLFLALIGLIGGIGLGLSARIGRFCTMGAIEDTLYGEGTGRLRMWGTAIVVAIFGTFYLRSTGTFDGMEMPYLSTPLNIVVAAVGGILFGYGMALTGTCGFGALARIGGGDFRGTIVALMMGVSAYFVFAGPGAYLREFMTNPAPPSLDYAGGYADWLARYTGLSAITIGYGIAALLAIVILKGWDLRKDKLRLVWGIVVGLSVTLGFAGTAYIAQTGFSNPAIESHSFAAPIGETMLYLMQGSARPLTFGIGSVTGVILGAAIGSLVKGEFRWEGCEDPRELRRQTFGAVFMGVGAVIAGGCTIGQGVSGISTLAYAAPFAMLGIFAGAAFGLRQLIEGFNAIPD